MHRKVGEPSIVDLQEVAEELRIGWLELVEEEGADLADRGLQSRVRLVHVLHRRLYGDAMSPQLLEHERVLRACVELPLVHEEREERSSRLVEQPCAEHARGAHLREHGGSVGAQVAEVEADDQHFAGLCAEGEVARSAEEPAHAGGGEKTPHLRRGVFLADRLEAPCYVGRRDLLAALEQGDRRLFDRLRELWPPSDAVDLAQHRQELRCEMFDLALGVRDLVEEVVCGRTALRRIDPAHPHAFLLRDRVSLLAVVPVEAKPDDAELPPAEPP